MTAGIAGNAGKTGADNTGTSRTMTWEMAVSADVGSAAAAAAAAAAIVGAPLTSAARTLWGLKNPKILESSTCGGGIMSAIPLASGDIDGAPKIAIDGAELGCLMMEKIASPDIN